MERCEICNNEFKTKGGLGAHKRFKHISPERPSPPLSGRTGEVKGTSPVSMTRFTSPKSARLRVVVTPSHWSRIETPAGTHMVVVQGKTAEFLDGLYFTNDPEIIDYLENRYKDDRFPVFSDRKLRDIGRGA